MVHVHYYGEPACGKTTKLAELARRDGGAVISIRNCTDAALVAHMRLGAVYVDDVLTDADVQRLGEAIRAARPSEITSAGEVRVLGAMNVRMSR